VGIADFFMAVQVEERPRRPLRHGRERLSCVSLGGSHRSFQESTSIPIVRLKAEIICKSGGESFGTERAVFESMAGLIRRCFGEKVRIFRSDYAELWGRRWQIWGLERLAMGERTANLRFIVEYSLLWMVLSQTLIKAGLTGERSGLRVFDSQVPKAGPGAPGYMRFDLQSPVPPPRRTRDRGHPQLDHARYETRATCRNLPERSRYRPSPAASF
jgi:hypothetical protein